MPIHDRTELMVIILNRKMSVNHNLVNYVLPSKNISLHTIMNERPFKPIIITSKRIKYYISVAVKPLFRAIKIHVY